MRNVEAWLWLLCMPDGPCRAAPVPRRPLRGNEWNELFRQADLHGVLPAVVRNVERWPPERAAELSPSADDRRACGAAMEHASRRVVERGAVSAALRKRGLRVVEALRGAGVPCVVLKGWAFAERLYPQPGLRPFIDVDLLVPGGMWEVVEREMAALGYRLLDSGPAGHGDAWSERQYEHPGFEGFLVEVHADLVNSDRLRRPGRGVSVTIDDLADGGQRGLVDPEITPAALLLIAAVHGAASHSFDKLQHLIDVSRIAGGCAGAVDSAWLAAAAARTGSRLSVSVALRLAGRVTGEPACERVLRASGLAIAARFWGAVLTERVVLAAQGPYRARSSWRRQLFRQRLKAGTRTAR